MAYSRESVDELLLSDNLDVSALAEAAYRDNHANVYALCLSILHESEDAHDAMQDAFIDALANIDRYEPRTNFRAWLLRIAVSKCYSILRRHSIQRRVQDAIGLLMPGNSTAVTERMSLIDLALDLRSAIDHLSPKHQIVIALRYGQGLSIYEIATLLGISEGTVHSRLHYATRNLRRLVRYDEKCLTKKVSSGNE